jgi:metal-responsive CopG/Arc/MetJ family transcriptional regulator
MANQGVLDKSVKITISLPASLLNIIDLLVQEQSSNRSAVIAEILSKIAQERFEAEMREGYLAMADLAKEVAEDYRSVGNETLIEY